MGVASKAKKVPRVRILGCRQKSFPLRYTFLLHCDVCETLQVSMFFLLEKTTCLEKSGSWVMVQKPQNKSECSIF